MIHRLLLAGASALAIATASPAFAEDGVRTFDIPAQPLSSALLAYSRATDTPVIASMDLLAGKTAPAIKGDMAEGQALAMLLQGTGLKAERGATGSIVVERVDAPQSGSAAGDGADGTVAELVVTAQKREENIQDVPIAISAFTQKSLDAQKLEGGFDLLKAIPNVTFSKNNFSGYNFSIRGVGTKAISATTDPGVAVSFNNTTLIVNRLFEQEYFDVERVEVLRGPQGTLYGRNATSGVINVLSARPRIGEFEGNIKLEAGNYNARRLRGMLNLPLGDQFAIRIAGALTRRDGYGHNEFDGSDVDDRNLWSTRMTLGWKPTEAFRANFLWERFEEDDKRVRTSKQLCHYDPGLQNEDFASATWEGVHSPFASYMQAGTSQGCLPGSLYDRGSVDDPNLTAGEAHGAYGTPNGASLPFVSGIVFGTAVGLLESYAGFGYNPYYGRPDLADCPLAASEDLFAMVPLNLCYPDPYAKRGQSRDLRTIYSTLQPAYRAKADIFELSFDWDVSENLRLSSQTVYTKDTYYATQDYNRFATVPIWNDSSLACATLFGMFGIEPCNPGEYAGGAMNVAPGGVLMDPQLGSSATLVIQDISQATSKQFSQEFRLASDFAGRTNFSVGANYTRFKTLNDYYVLSNAFTMIARGYPFNNPVASGLFGPNGSRCALVGEGCTYIDPNPLNEINGEGHNYFRSANPFKLNSTGVFGELYWKVTETVKLTVGARMTWDEKVFTPVPSQLLLRDYRDYPNLFETVGDLNTCDQFECYYLGTGEGGRGYPANPPIVQKWEEPTGRVVLDWTPNLAFTDQTMIYASYAHGYKGGGANPPTVAPPSGALLARFQGVSVPPTFDPEFVDAFEVGTKNALMGGGLILNATAFFYDYQGYQVSKIVDRSAANENFDAKVWGAELEWVFSPSRHLRFNGTFGALRTKIADGERSLDLMDRAQGGRHNSWIDANGVEHALGYDEWVVLKPWVTTASNCVAPKVLVEAIVADGEAIQGLMSLCPPGGVTGTDFRPAGSPNHLEAPLGPSNDVPGMPGVRYDPTIEAPNAGAGFLDELGGNDLPNAPHWTASLGGQYTMALPAGWDATLRGDFYWQSQSYHRVYNTQYDKLRAWTNTNISLWFEKADWGVVAEVYVKNVFDETPITDAFLNSDDSGLTTNVFTLDPRLIGVSIKKDF